MTDDPERPNIPPNKSSRRAKAMTAAAMETQAATALVLVPAAARPPIRLSRGRCSTMARSTASPAKW